MPHASTPIAIPASPSTTASRYHTAGGRAFNFNAGPSILPEEVIRTFQEDMWNFRGSGLGILEHSHRDKWFDELLFETIDLVRKVGSIPKNYHILFMTGGSSSQNFIVPYNLLPKGRTADYIDTDFWSSRSIEDARQFGAGVHVAFTGKSEKYTRIPAASEISYSENPAYVHFTSNNTIYGTQFRTEPTPPSNGAYLVCDACSDIFSRPIDFSKYGLVYASVQKNLGITGATLVVVRDDLVQNSNADVPRMLQYRTMVKEESRPNTPPHFAIYSASVMMRWILSQGGLGAMEKRNQEKAAVIYGALDGSAGFYRAHAEKNSRSLMNITFRLATEELEARFLNEAAAAGLMGMKGHRATGGCRVSIYNAFPIEGCRALAEFMGEFARKNG